MRKQKFSLVNAICFVSLLSTVSFDLLAITYEYDALSRLTSVTYDNGDKISYNYDPAGNITKTISAQVGVDSDNDGVDDIDDAFPDNPNETLDTDGDNIGNNEDLDDDNDGVSDEDEIAQGTDPLVVDNDSAGSEDIVVSDLLLGHVTFKDADNNNIAVPSDAWVGITPSVYQGDENGWNRVRCSIDSSGNFGQACYFNEDEAGMRQAISNANETYQIVVFKNHVEPQKNDWNCGEDLYGYGLNNDWTEIVVRPGHYSDRSQEQCSDSNPDSEIAALDVDKSGSINSFDLLLIQRYLGGVSNISVNIQLPENVGGAGLDGRMTNDELKDTIESMFLKASLDVDGDGDTDVFDILMIQRHLGGVSNLSVNILLPTGVGGEALEGALSNDEIRQAIEHVLSQSDADGITLPFSFSKFQIENDDNGGIKIKRKENVGTIEGVFTHTEYQFDAVNGEWNEPIETNADSRYNLVAGQWIAMEDSNDGTVNVNGGIAIFPEVNAKLVVISTQDLSNTTQTIPDFKIDVTFSEGAESYSLGFDHVYETYRLESSVRHGNFDSAQSDYVNLLEFINAQSNNYWFLGPDDEFNGGGSFQKPSTSTIQDGSTGNLIEWNDSNGQANGVIGTWTVAKIPGTEIIAVFIDIDDAHRYRYSHQENYFYAYHSTSGKVYEGRHLTVQGEFEDTGEVNYNSIATADITKAIEEHDWLTGTPSEPCSGDCSQASSMFYGLWKEQSSDYFDASNPDFLVIDSNGTTTYYYNNPSYNLGNCVSSSDRGAIDSNNQLGGDGLSTFNLSSDGKLIETNDKNGNSTYIRAIELEGKCLSPVTEVNSSTLTTRLSGQTWAELKPGNDFPTSCYVFSNTNNITVYFDGNASEGINIQYEVTDNQLRYLLNGTFVSSTDTFSALGDNEFSVHKDWSDDTQYRKWISMSNCLDNIKPDPED